MQRLMLSLDALVHRRRRWVLAAWLVALIAALPLAARQSDHLTGGGFGVPGSQSDRVEKALEPRLRPRAGGDARRGARAPGRARARPTSARRSRACDAAAAATDHVALAPAARRAALAQVDRGGARPVVVPLRIDVPETQSPDVATGLRDRLGLGTPAGGPVATHLVGQGALWAGLQDVEQVRPRAGRVDRPADRRAHPARRVRLARRGGAAARPRRRSR